MWLFGLLSTSAGILVGGMFAWLFKGLEQRIDIVYGVCGGILLGLISMEIFPEAIELGGWWITVIGLVAGMIIFKLIHKALNEHHTLDNASKEKMYFHTGLLLFISFSVHNIPMGIILGVSQENQLTVSVLQTLLFHSIPEGIILFTPLILAGINRFRGFLITLLVSSPVAIGVLIGGFFNLNHQYTSAVLIGSTVGIILMVTVSEILYPALIKSSMLRIVIYVLIGFSITGVYLNLV